MEGKIPFEPFRIFKGSHAQTIVGSFFHFTRDPVSKTELVPLEDGDKIAIEITTPESWKETDKTILMVHGLCGSHRSPYLVRMTHRLSSLGYRCIRINLRGCGSGKGHAKYIYHSGRSEDIHEVLRFVQKKHPQSKNILMGFSLGANIVVKLAGELGPIGFDFLEKVIAVSPPADLYSSVKMLGSKENRFYERYFLRLLKADAKYRLKKYPDLPKVEFPKNMNLELFDECYTAPLSGFRSALDYYEKCSSKWVIEEIEIPCYILFAEDDPIISPSSLDQFSIPSNLKIFKTKNGGHLGFLGSPFSGKYHWMDNLLLEWIQKDSSS